MSIGGRREPGLSLRAGRDHQRGPTEPCASLSAQREIHRLPASRQARAAASRTLELSGSLSGASLGGSWLTERRAPRGFPRPLAQPACRRNL